jgi:hypothetical protein
MAIFHGNRGDWYCCDYTVGADPAVKYKKLFLRDKDKISIEGSLITMLARHHEVACGQIGIVNPIVRVDE